MSESVLQQIKDTVRSSRRFDDFLKARQTHNKLAIRNAAGSLAPIVLSLLQEQTGSSLLIVLPFADHAERLKDEMAELAPKSKVIYFPQSKVMPWGHRDTPTLSHQLEAIESLAANSAQPYVLLATPRAILTPLLPPESIQQGRIELKVDEELPFDELVEQLVKMDFDRQPLVEQPGELSVRGGIIDVFPFSRPAPIRLEFWGDRVESIREFDPVTQRSDKEISLAFIFPQKIEGDEQQTKPCTLLNYLSKNTQVCFFKPEQIAASLTDQKANSDDEDTEWLADASLDGAEGDVWLAFLDRFNEFPQIFFSQFAEKNAVSLDFEAAPQPTLHGNLKALNQEISIFMTRIQNESQLASPRLFLACESPTHAQRLSALFEESELAGFNITVFSAALNGGFVLPEQGLALYTDHEFYGRVRLARRGKKHKHGLTFRQLKTLGRGDYVVHVDHGIGIYQGLEKLTIGTHERECIVIHYQDNDKLFVPLDKMDRVQKYTSRQAVVPRINKLGTPDWERLKNRTHKRIKDIARDLIKLYAARKAQTGYAFSPDSHWQRELEASFAYEETVDQVRAVEEVKADMESDRPMDRLVCGDVGFGKTEVAIRAAFKAVQDGKQVAILVPTTLLAQQHQTTFTERLSNYPIAIEMLSRFRSKAEQKQVVDRLKAGGVDIVIGTHRLLSKDISFKDLGLITIDEEQRFGVRHKELLKRLKTNVDVLTLSATPIPRTLHMSLMGVRDMTAINTPPRDRVPIHTEVVQFDRDLIRQAVLREIHRGGQVFFVHNRVSSIHRMASLLHHLIPEVTIGVAHGQMDEHDLEKVMLDFVNRKFHVLIATMIIESGLDMPNVNTMIINRADRFGLAQLYQLRGRVGRSHYKAFCYLLIPPIRNLSLDAIKRLETIEEFTDLGSGFQIAMRDLEIRGAGNLLGAEQSGVIDAIGFDLFTRILEQAVREARHEEMPEAEALPPRKDECRVELDDDAVLPESYVSLPQERVAIYRRLAEATSVKEIDAIEAELADRFGRLPDAARNLLGLVSLRLLGTALGLRSLRILARESLAVFADGAQPESRETFKQWIGMLMQRAPYPIEFFQNGGLGFRMAVPKGQPAMPRTVKLLASLSEAGTAS